MNKRTYKKYTEVYNSLRQYCLDVCDSGKSRILPGERELAAELCTSRMTLRKALEKAEMDGLIRRTKKLTEVLSQQPTLHKCGKILFISTGYRNEFTLGAFQRLWFSLKTYLGNMGADFELLLTNDLITKTEIQERCEAANVILLTSIQYNSPNVNVDFISAMKSRKTIIALSDPYLEQFDNYIALDNYAVGEFAARTLQLAGCQRPVFITTGFSNMMFHKRFYGFYDSMQRIGIDVPKEFPRTGPLHFIEGRKRELLNAINRGCDGAFIVSDEGIDFITHDLFSQNLIPDKFKLITLNGKGEAMLCNPPITCVNHATAGVTEILLNYLKVISKNINPPCIKKLVQPDLYLSETIGKIDIDLLERKAW